LLGRSPPRGLLIGLGRQDGWSGSGLGGARKRIRPDDREQGEPDHERQGATTAAPSM
jgi:hypothetical protein